MLQEFTGIPFSFDRSICPAMNDLLRKQGNSHSVLHLLFCLVSLQPMGCFNNRGSFDPRHGKKLMTRFTWPLLVSLILGSVAYAQDTPKAEVTGYYSYFRFNPENSGTLSSHSLNGGGGDISYYLTPMFGIKAEFAGYQSNKVTFANGSILASASANLFTYNVGPIIKARSGRFEPFAEALFGGAHSSFYGNLCKAFSGCAVNNPSNNAFDFVIGGGVDIPLSHSIAFRPVEADYVLTRFGNGFTSGNQNQSNFRYQAGIQFRF